jgi:hypothetical protein
MVVVAKSYLGGPSRRAFAKFQQLNSRAMVGPDHLDLLGDHAGAPMEGEALGFGSGRFGRSRTTSHAERFRSRRARFATARQKWRSGLKQKAYLFIAGGRNWVKMRSLHAFIDCIQTRRLSPFGSQVTRPRHRAAYQICPFYRTKLGRSASSEMTAVSERCIIAHGIGDAVASTRNIRETLLTLIPNETELIEGSAQRVLC